LFDSCAAAQARGNEFYIQITCQPLSFDFTLANAYPFYSHPAFDPIKAYDREQLRAVFRDGSFSAFAPICATRSRARYSRETGSASLLLRR
jgi:N-acyl-D-amino-acid deacylase